MFGFCFLVIWQLFSKLESFVAGTVKKGGAGWIAAAGLSVAELVLVKKKAKGRLALCLPNAPASLTFVNKMK